MRASIIIVSYNSRAYLDACITSLHRQIGPHDELIVVDNGSSDGSADLVQERFPWATLVRGENTGYAGGNNRGANLARGAYLVFLNPDTWLAPGALDALLAPLMPASDLALSTACIVYMDRPEIINTCGNTVHYTGLAYCRGAGRRREELAESVEVDAVSGAAFAIRREVFAALDGFDKRFFMYVEDTDLSWRARLAGYRCWYAADALVLHDYHPAYSPAKAFYLDRNRHLMLLKNLSWATYRRLLPGLLLGELVTWGFLLMQGPRYWRVKLRVYAWFWRERHTISRLGRATSGADRTLVARLTHRLEFGQLAGRTISRAAALIFHPAFRAAQLFVGEVQV